MKSFFTSILLLIYFIVSSGFAVNLHYCMNKFHSWEIGVSEKEKCGKCGMKSKKSSSCCQDEVKLIKLQQDSLTAKTATFFFAMPQLVLATTIFILQPFQSFQSVKQISLKGPPPLSDLDVFIRNCVFRL